MGLHRALILCYLMCLPALLYSAEVTGDLPGVQLQKVKSTSAKASAKQETKDKKQNPFFGWLEELGREVDQQASAGKTDDELEEVLIKGVLSAITEQTRSVREAVRITGDTLAGLTGGSVKTVGATVKGVGSLLDGASDVLEARQKSAVQGEKGTPKGAKGKGGVIGAVAAIGDIGRNAAADVLAASGTTVKGLGEAVYEIGGLGEDIIGAVGEVGEGFVKIFEDGFEKARDDFVISQEKMRGGAAKDINLPALGSPRDYSAQEGLPAGSTLEEEERGFFAGAKDFLDPLLQSVGALALGFVGLFGSTQGVPSLAVPLLLSLLGSGVVMLRIKRKSRRFILMFLMWTVVARLDQRQRYQLVWVAKDESLKASLESHVQGVETVSWLNRMVQALWFEGRGLGRHVGEEMGKSMQEALEETAPTMVAQVTVQEVYLGSEPPRLVGVEVLKESDGIGRVGPHKTEHFRVGLYSVSRDMGIRFELKLSNRKRSILPVQLITLNQLMIDGQFIISMEILPEFPFIGTVLVSFDRVPKLDIKLAGAGLEWADDWVRFAARESLRLLVKPKYVEINAAEIICPECNTVVGKLLPPTEEECSVPTLTGWDGAVSPVCSL